jgi:type I restriction enzyme, S subunit
MTNWKEYKLSELMQIKYGKDHRHLADGPFPLYGSGGIMRYVEMPLYSEASILIPRKGTLSNLFYLDKPFWSVDTMFYSIINEQLALPQYLFYTLKTFDLASLNVGSAVPSLTTQVLNEVLVSLPALPTQTAIAEILSSLDDKIELNNKINQELEALAQTLFKQWFIDFEFPDVTGNPYKSSGGEMVDSALGEIPKGWCVGTLNDLIDFSNGNAFKSNELLNEDTGDCYHVFKMGHIKKGGGLNADATKSYYEKSKAKKLEKYVLKVGDLLMCMTDMKGNVALLGHTALMNENNKYIVNQRVGLLRPNNDLGIDFPYLYILTNSNDFIEDLRSRANSGVQVNLSTSEIKSSKVLLPPKFINIEFDNCVKSFFESIFNNTKENTELAILRDTLLPKLISGELEVSQALTQTTA